MIFPKELFSKYKGRTRNAKRRINGILRQVLCFDEDILKVDVPEQDMKRIIKIAKEGGENLDKQWDCGVPKKVYKKIVKMHREGASNGQIAQCLNMSIYTIQKITSHL